MRDFTFIVKSFERPSALAMLIASLRERYPRERVIVADDSKDRMPRYSDDYEMIRLPFDTGLSAGRNALIAKVETPFFILLDDDFIFTEATKIERLVSIAERCGHDVVGGAVIEKGEVRHYEGNLRQSGTTLRYVPQFREDHGSHKTCDMVLNFFAGRTEKVKKVGWDPDLKLAEHTDFFLRAKGKISVAYCPTVSIVHTKERDPHYDEYRVRAKHFMRVFMKKHRLKMMVNFSGSRFRLK